MREIVAGRWGFNRKSQQIGENRQNDNSVRSENAHATAKAKVNALVHVNCASLSVAGLLAGWLAGRFGALVFRCLRVAVSLCLCALAWPLFKFRRWSIGQGRKIKKGPFPNVNHLNRSACHSLRLVCACVRLRSPCRQRVPKNDRRRVRRILLQHRCVKLCARPSQDAGNSTGNCAKSAKICKM